MFVLGSTECWKIILGTEACYLGAVCSSQVWRTLEKSIPGCLSTPLKNWKSGKQCKLAVFTSATPTIKFHWSKSDVKALHVDGNFETYQPALGLYQKVSLLNGERKKSWSMNPLTIVDFISNCRRNCPTCLFGESFFGQHLWKKTRKRGWCLLSKMQIRYVELWYLFLAGMLHDEHLMEKNAGRADNIWHLELVGLNW